MSDLFELGEIEISPAAEAALAAAERPATIFLDKHRRGDWGELEAGRRQSNELAVGTGEKITSRYLLSDTAVLMVSTARDRSYTRVYLEAEYQYQELDLLAGYALWSTIYDREQNPLIEVEGKQVADLIADLPLRRGLDVGAGTGRHALTLARRGVRVTAVDQSPQMLAQAQSKSRTEGVGIDIALAGLAAGLPFAAAQFDFLICGLVFCHLPDLRSVCGEFERVLAPGGYLMVTDFHPGAVAVGWRTQFSLPGRTHYLPNEPHTRADYLAAVEGAGFSIIAVRDLPVRAAPPGYLSQAILEAQGDLPLCLIILARKK